MGRPNSLNPARKLNVTIPEALLTMCRASARLEKLSLSAWIAERVKDYFRNMERALR